MGVSYNATAVLGIKIDRYRLHEKRTVKAYDHNYPESMKFDPQTGNKLWVQQESLISAINHYDESDDYMLGPFKVIFISESEDCYVVLSSVSTDRRPKKTEANFNREELQQVLEPLGLWDEKQFGLWAIVEIC